MKKLSLFLLCLNHTSLFADTAHVALPPAPDVPSVADVEVPAKGVIVAEPAEDPLQSEITISPAVSVSIGHVYGKDVLDTWQDTLKIPISVKLIEQYSPCTVLSLEYASSLKKSGLEAPNTFIFGIKHQDLQCKLGKQSSLADEIAGFTQDEVHGRDEECFGTGSSSSLFTGLYDGHPNFSGGVQLLYPRNKAKEHPHGIGLGGLVKCKFSYLTVGVAGSIASPPASEDKDESKASFIDLKREHWLVMPGLEYKQGLWSFGMAGSWSNKILTLEYEEEEKTSPSTSAEVSVVEAPKKKPKMEKKSAAADCAFGGEVKLTYKRKKITIEGAYGYQRADFSEALKGFNTKSAKNWCDQLSTKNYARVKGSWKATPCFTVSLGYTYDMTGQTIGTPSEDEWACAQKIKLGRTWFGREGGFLDRSNVVLSFKFEMKKLRWKL